MMNQIFLKVLLHFLKESQATDMVCLVNLFLQESEIKVDSLPQTVISYRSFCPLVERKNTILF